jgi:FAD:protein FMN transferase
VLTVQAPPIISVRPCVPELVGRPFKVFGTFGMILVTRPASLRAADVIVARQLRAIDLACSRFRADSELSTVNRAEGRTVPISPLFARALAAALRAAEITDGDVDPTCGTSLERLGYDRDFRDLRPVEAPVTPVPAGGWRTVCLDTEHGTVRLPAGVRLDLGATAKALAADLAAAAAAAATGAGVLVNLGGDIAVAGPPPAAGWRVQICAEPPDGRGGIRGPMVMIFDGGLATSGTLMRSWRAGGQRLHHILVPCTGLPTASCWVSATVAAASCLDANTASTAAIIRSQGAAGWLACLGLPARLVGTDGTIVTTGAWPS